MKKYITLTVYLLITFTAFTQPLKLPLTEKHGRSFSLQSNARFDDGPVQNSYSGFDSTKYENFTIKRIYFSALQFTLERDFIDRNRTRESTFAWYRKYGDTTYILYQKLPRNWAAYLHATDKAGLIHFIMDANNNQRFDDDQEYIFDTTSTERHYPEVNVNFDYFNGRTIQPITVPYTVNVYSSRFPPMFIDGKKMERLVHMGCPLYKEARYTSGRSEYVFHVTTNYMGVYKNVPFKLAIQLISKNDTIENYPYNYISTEILEFNQGLYKIDSLSKDTLYLNKIENTLYDGGRQGSMAHEISGEGIMDSKPYSLRKQRGKYTVINFWGSWCTPCIEELPELKALQEKYNKISFLSVAADYPRDIPALKKLITDNNLTWPQLSFDRSKLREGVLYNYKIQAFPTTILVDPNGKIVVRGRSASALKEIDNYLIEKKIF